MSRGFERVEVVADNADLRFRALHCQPEGQMVEQGQDLALLDLWGRWTSRRTTTPRALLLVMMEMKS
jgi:hypothetical protein